MAAMLEFSPKSIFFTSENRKGWTDCFGTKAAAVYRAIFPAENVVPGTTAENLLKFIAKNCETTIKNKKLRGEIKIPSKEDAFHSSLWEIENTLQTSTENLLNNQDIIESIDAVYLVVGFLRDFKAYIGKGSIDRETVDKDMSRHGSNVLSDIPMLGIQLPLGIIVDVVHNLDIALTETASQLKLHPDLISIQMDTFEKFKLDIKDKLSEVLSLFSWYYSPFLADKNKFQGPKLDQPSEKIQNLLECIYYCIVKKDCDSDKTRIPNAKELVRAGVRFEANTEQFVKIKFNEPVLKLPVLFFDSKLETVVMNLVALESSCCSTTRPVTRYFQLMKELVDDVGDVGVLRTAGVVLGSWQREQDVVDLVRRVGVSISIDLELVNLRDYLDKKKKTFFARPAVRLVSSVAAVSLVAAAIFVVKMRKSSKSKDIFD